MTPPRFTAHVVSHTHWDREWYRTFEVFRMRLVDLVDALLDLLEKDPAYGPFYLDGQMCVIEDYLAVRPENADRLGRLVEQGRIYSGPWYIQPDEFLVSGEALIRNLLLGRRLADRWRTGHAVGYAPDAFGHTSQMPQILRGFGMDNAVLFRGITADQVPAEFEWRSPDGSSVLCIKMPDDNAYSNWFYRFRETLADTDRGIPLDEERVVREGTALLEDCIAERPMTRYLLWMDGVDHVFPQPRTPEIIRILNRRLGERVEVRSTTLREHVDAVLREAADLPVVTGELRIPNRKWKLQALLAHVASSRIHLKQRNHACETLLERWAEPFSTIVWMLAQRLGPPSQPDRLPGHAVSSPAAMLRYAWKMLLLNQPHDSICGCSIDQVHRDMLPRYDAVEQVGEALTSRALHSLAEWIRTIPPGDCTSVRDQHHEAPDPRWAIVVFNPLGWERDGEPVETLVHIPPSEAPASVGVWHNGAEVPCVVEELPPGHTLTQAPHDIPAGMAWRRLRVRFPAGAPGLGYRVYHLASKEPALPVPGRLAVHADGNSISNGQIRVEAAADGTLTLTDLRTGHVYTGLAALEDGGDFGDGYNYVRPKEDRVLRSSEPLPAGSDRTVEVISSVFGGAIAIRHLWFVPAGRDGDRRDAETQSAISVTVQATVYPGSSVVRLDVQVHNEARDHRLRILFPSGAREAKDVDVEQAFDVVRRPIAKPDRTGWREPDPGTGPQKSWVDVSDGTKGLCVINVGLPECEVLDDEYRTVAVTLLRCTGQGVGLPEDQRDSQMLGSYAFRLALLPHAGTWLDDRVWRAAHEVNVPMRAVQTGLHEGPLEPEASLVQVDPEELVLTAVKVSEDEAGAIVRAVNYGEEPVLSSVKFPAASNSQPQRVRLDEEPCEDGLVVKPREIVTLNFHGAQS